VAGIVLNRRGEFDRADGGPEARTRRSSAARPARVRIQVNQQGAGWPMALSQSDWVAI